MGGHTKRLVQYGYLKQSGDDGVLAIRLSNGSSFGIPNATAPGLQSRPYGSTPEEHDRFVKDYFVRLAIPTDQVSGVHTMTMLAANGRTGETSKNKPAVTAYYSVLERAVEGLPIPDSFAWARVTADGKVVAEGVYWPALSGDVVSGAKRLRDVLSEPARRTALESRIPGAKSDGDVAIRHASAWVDSTFEAFPSFDVVVVAQVTRNDSTAAHDAADGSTLHRSPAGQAIVRHFDADGVERFLPQEKRNVGDVVPRRTHKHAK